jgi:uncharacterized protein (TIGR02453 family)
VTSPQFPTFPEAGLRFLRRLKRNNNRNWFQTHKTEYEECVKKPMEELVKALSLEFATIAPEIEASPRTSLYRINRDTRFSKNKAPYKTHVAAVFPVQALGKHEGAGLYFHISQEELLIGGGMYMPATEDLRHVRHAIANHVAEFQAIISNRRFRRLFGELTGERLARVPRGFSPDHPAAEYLRLKQYLAGRRLPPQSAASREFVTTLLETFVALLPLLRFLNEPILERKRIKDRKESFLV